jgi:hypothetical protein
VKKRRAGWEHQYIIRAMWSSDAADDEKKEGERGEKKLECE